MITVFSDGGLAELLRIGAADTNVSAMQKTGVSRLTSHGSRLNGNVCILREIFFRPWRQFFIDLNA
jgi:hypothetical protein